MSRNSVFCEYTNTHLGLDHVAAVIVPLDMIAKPYAHLCDSLVGIQATHAVLEGGENSTLDVQGPQLVVLRGTQLFHHAILEGEAEGLSFQHGGCAC